MPIVSTSDFIGELTIAQIEQPAVASVVNQFIVKYEAEYLKKVLGYTLLTAYNTGISQSLPLYTSLRDGGTYIDYTGNTVYYAGLKEAIANFIYFHYIRSISTFTTGSGDKVVEKGIGFSSIDKQVRAWNKMVELNKSLKYFLIADPNYGYVNNYHFNEMFRHTNFAGL